MTKRYFIESRGVAATPGLNRVIDTSRANTGVLYFETQGAALAHKAAILGDQPSKYLPLVVTSETVPVAQLAIAPDASIVAEPVQAPEENHESMRLFEPAPTQITGQMFL